MNGQQPVTERRKHKRYAVQEGAFALIWPKFTKAGEIIDFSMAGLAFRYPESTRSLDESRELDILLQDNDFYLDRIPIRPVYDLEIDEKSLRTSIRMRRMGVQFRHLTNEKISKLKYFIKNHTTGEA